MQIAIPNPDRNRALFIIDIQPGFLQAEHTSVVPGVVNLIKNGGYEMFVVIEFRASKGTLWDHQMGYIAPHAPTVPEITDELDTKKTISIIKTTKSAFIMKPYLASELRTKDIEEIHCVGYDINDSVLCTANDAFDLGFFTYVIEECAYSSQNDQLRNAALMILRENEMTNHSELISNKKEI